MIRPSSFHIVLVEPEIPQNTGSIGRLCLATGTNLHLIQPLGFELSSSKLKRAGLDYWQHLNVNVYLDLCSFLAQIPVGVPRVFFTKKATVSLYQHTFVAGSYLFFGKETAGLPQELINNHSSETAKIPLFDSRVRSLNLAQAVAISLYEGIRQLNYK